MSGLALRSLFSPSSISILGTESSLLGGTWCHLQGQIPFPMHWRVPVTVLCFHLPPRRSSLRQPVLLQLVLLHGPLLLLQPHAVHHRPSSNAVFLRENLCSFYHIHFKVLTLLAFCSQTKCEFWGCRVFNFMSINLFNEMRKNLRQSKGMNFKSLGVGVGRKCEELKMVEESVGRSRVKGG